MLASETTLWISLFSFYLNPTQWHIASFPPTQSTIQVKFFRQAPETSVQILRHEANEQNNETFQLCQISPDDMKIQLHTVKGDLGDIYSFFCKMFK